MEGPVFSPDVLDRPATEAAREVLAVSGLKQAPRSRVRVRRTGVFVRLALDPGASGVSVGRQVQERVSECPERMTNRRIEPAAAVVERVGAPSSKR